MTELAPIPADHHEGLRDLTADRTWRDFPWWLLAIFAFLIIMTLYIIFGEEFRSAFNFIAVQEVFLGLRTTIQVTLIAFLFAAIIGLLAGLGRISSNTFLRNLAMTYIEFIRGVPILVLIFTVALVFVPTVTRWLGLPNAAVSQQARAVSALALIYGAFLAEVFRAGIESVPQGQMEAARSLGMTHGQAMRSIILPQAIRNIMPALGNNFIAMLKDSSLVSVLAVQDITYRARVYSGSSFRFRETYLVLTFLYLSMTIALSLVLQWYERRIGTGR